MSLSIIIPVKNEEDIILETLHQFEISWLTNIDHEILIIDDNSDDKTFKLVNKFVSQKIKVNLIKNKGKDLGAAIITGIENSSKLNVAIYMSDMSDSLEDLKQYYDFINSNDQIDAVFGSRFISGSKVNNYPKLKLFLNRIANNIIKIIFFSKYNDFTNAF